jgi:glycerophosphoryl diester phosphodiesterase
MKILVKKERRSKHRKTLLLFEALHKSIFLIILLPLASYAFQLALKASDYSYITLQNLFSFATSPVTLLVIFLLLTIAASLFYVEMIALYQYYHSSQRISKMYVGHLLFPGMKQALVMFCKKGNKFLPFFCMMSYVAYSFPLFIGMISRQRIPAYFLESILQEAWVIPVLIAVSFLLLYICYSGMFTVLYCCFDGVSFYRGFRMSKNTIRGNKMSIFKTLIFRNIILCVIYFVLYYAIVIISGTITFFAVKESLSTAMFLTTYDQINRYYSYMAGVIGVIVNCKIIYGLFMRHRITTSKIPNYVTKYQEKISTEAKYSHIVLYISIGSMIILFASFVFHYTNTFRKKPSLFGTDITAHRGYSSIAPENTLPAIQEAIDAMSDYVEIDVQETKDGVVILLHDTNLKRTTGINKSIWNVTYEELRNFDAGKKARKIYRNTPIPTLEEALLLCQNSIYLNIEIKITNHEQQLVEEVVRLIKEYDMEDQCVISSTNYGALGLVKQMDETIKTGYIMSIAYGYFYNREYVDFFSVKSSFITQDMIQLAHSNGKEIHAWTVNGVSEIQRMKQLGVDNILTDYPIRVREILYEDKLTTSFLDFLRTLTQ